MNIIVKPYRNQYVAYWEGKEEMQGQGMTRTEAIGELIKKISRLRPEVISVENRMD